MKRSVVIFGTGEFAEVADFYLTEDSEYDVQAFTVNKSYIESGTLRGRPVVPFESLEESHPPDKHSMLVAVGFSRVNRTRTEIVRRCKLRGYDLVSYISSKATTWSDLAVGENTFIFEDNVIQPFVTIGDNVIVWSGNHIGHHAIVEDNCFISSHVVVSGGVVIGEGCFLGVNATIRDHITIAPYTVVGAGAVIMSDTQAEDVYVAPKGVKSSRKSSQLGL